MKYLPIFALFWTISAHSVEYIDKNSQKYMDIFNSFDEVSKLEQCKIIVLATDKPKTVLEKECFRLVHNAKIAENIGIKQAHIQYKYENIK